MLQIDRHTDNSLTGNRKRSLESLGLDFSKKKNHKSKLKLNSEFLLKYLSLFSNLRKLRYLNILKKLKFISLLKMGKKKKESNHISNM